MKTAIILPAFNEELTITDTIRDFHTVLPQAEIYIVDNNSSDHTGQLAHALLQELKINGGVIFESRQGKGNALKTAFSKIDADIYVLADADSTYPAHHAPDLITVLLKNDADMVVGNRQAFNNYAEQNKRPFHVFGNWLVNCLVNKLFSAHLADIMSGYRVFSRRFVKNYPILVEGFEIETDMTLHALHHRFKVMEIGITYAERPAGSTSKLNTMTDGLRVIFTLMQIFRFYRPLFFFGMLSLFFCFLSLIAGYFPVKEFIHSHYITKVPLAILASGLGLLSVVLLATGLILDAVRRKEDLQYQLNLLRQS